MKDCGYLDGVPQGPGTRCATQACPLCQMPDQGPHAGWAIAHTDADWGTKAADSFSFTVDTPVQRISWWGAHESADHLCVECDPLPIADTFTVAFYTDQDGEPGTLVSLNSVASANARVPTGEMIWGGPSCEFPEYLYTTDLDNPFVAVAGET
ncbi:MAG TPA: hypothetical protein VM243_01675 [Phycisphaerae bacterium]|nr:hypothetical protein [Phycisphaerae bacterium]